MEPRALYTATYLRVSSASFLIGETVLRLQIVEQVRTDTRRRRLPIEPILVMFLEDDRVWCFS